MHTPDGERVSVLTKNYPSKSKDVTPASSIALYKGIFWETAPVLRSDKNMRTQIMLDLMNELTMSS